MRTVIKDFRFAFRVLLKRPAFTIAAIISLALGIGATTAIFSFVDAMLLRSLPFPEAERIVQLREVNERGVKIPVAVPNYEDVTSNNQSFEAIAHYWGGRTTIAGGSEPVRARAFAVSADFFRVLGVQAFKGRTFSPDESKANGNPAAVVSYGFWQKLLAAKEDVKGTKLNLYDMSFDVIGVMPQGFNFPSETEVWIPSELYPSRGTRTAHNVSVVARLRKDVPLNQAQTETTHLAKRLREQYGKETDAVDFALIPLQEYIVGESRQGLMLIFGAVGLLLIIACANVANLLLAQSTGRQKELAIRTALGATRWRIVRQSFAECVLLTLIAGTIGVLFSIWGVEFLVSLSQSSLPRTDEIGIDTRILIFTVAVSVLIGAVLGFVTALRGSNNEVNLGLREAGNHQSASPVNKQIRNSLVVAQFALTLVLLVGAGLLVRSFQRLLEIDPGFQSDNVVVMDVNYSAAGDDAQPVARFHQQLLDRISQLRGVISVGGINSLPMTGGGANGQFLIDNDPDKKGYAEYRLASAGYFEALGIPLLRGRLFDKSDQPNTTHVAVINQSLAEKFWKNEDPIGKQIQFGNMDGDKRLIQIVGIVGDVREQGLDKELLPTVYAYYLQRPNAIDNFSIAARTDADGAALISAMRGEVRSLNSEVPTNFRTLGAIFSSSLDKRKFSLVLFAAFAIVALLLAVTGIYGVMSYTVTQRTHEIGIRMSLGAKQGDVLKLIIKQGMIMATIGIVIGLIASFALSKLITSYLYGISATDPLTFITIALLLLFVAFAACFLPARRATKVDPVIALRYE